MVAAAAPTNPFAELLATGLRDLQITKWMCAAGLAVIVWDYLLTFDDERRFVWGRRLSLLQVLFYLNRYPPIFFQLANVVYLHLPSESLSDRLCQTFQLGVVPAQVEIQWSIAAVIIAHRLWALYADSRFMKALIVTTCMLSVIALMVINIVILPLHRAAADGLPFGLRLCHPTTSLRDAWAPATPAIVFDVFAFTLALVKIVSHRHTATRLRGTGHSMRIYDSMAASSAMYFVTMLVGHLTTMITATKRESLNFVWIPMMFSLGSIACNHMVMDVRSASAPPTSTAESVHPEDYKFASKVVLSGLKACKTANSYEVSFPMLSRGARPDSSDGESFDSFVGAYLTYAVPIPSRWADEVMVIA